MYLLNQIAKHNDKNPKHLTLVVLIDISEANEMISYGVLLDKLEYLGIRSVTNKWCKRYRSRRVQYIELFNINL